jgi:hypothetical protein
MISGGRRLSTKSIAAAPDALSGSVVKIPGREVLVAERSHISPSA